MTKWIFAGILSLVYICAVDATPTTAPSYHLIQFGSAEIYKNAPDGRTKGGHRVILNGEEANALAAVFPKLGEHCKSDRAAFWTAGWELTFFISKHVSARVEIDLDTTVWTEGDGDWVLTKQAVEKLQSLYERGGAAVK